MSRKRPLEESDDVAAIKRRKVVKEKKETQRQDIAAFRISRHRKADLIDLMVKHWPESQVCILNKGGEQITTRCKKTLLNHHDEETIRFSAWMEAIKIDPTWRNHLRKVQGILKKNDLLFLFQNKLSVYSKTKKDNLLKLKQDIARYKGAIEAIQKAMFHLPLLPLLFRSLGDQGKKKVCFIQIDFVKKNTSDDGLHHFFGKSGGTRRFRSNP